MPFLAELAHEVGGHRHRLRRSIIEGPEGVTVALAGGERGVEANANHVDDLVLAEHGLAGEAYVGEKPALVCVDIVLDHELLGLAASYVGLGFVIRHDELDRPAVDAAGLVDAIDRHLRADQSRLAASGRGSGERLERADLVRLRLAEGGLPRGRHQHGGAERARAISDEATACHLAAVPEFIAPIRCCLVVNHCCSSGIGCRFVARY